MPFRFLSRKAADKRTGPSDDESLLMKNADEGKSIAYYPKGEHRSAYWKVSSAAGTSRVFPEDTLKVPDSAIRRGETDAEWRLRMLIRDLQALASDPDTLIAAYDARVPVVYELVNDFRTHLEWAAVRSVKGGAMTQEMWNTASAVDARLGEMPELENCTRWTAEGLRRSSIWGDARMLARKALTAMGRPLEPPPPRSM